MQLAEKGIDYLSVGQTVTFTKTVGEFDIYLFAGITGDFAPQHVSEEFMKGTRYGRRIAHGCLMIGYMSTASTKISQGVPFPCVSYGYDRVRFPKPVFIGDTITVEYKIVEKDEAKNRTIGQVTVTNQREEVVAVASHILQFV